MSEKSKESGEGSATANLPKKTPPKPKSAARRPPSPQRAAKKPVGPAAVARSAEKNSPASKNRPASKPTKGKSSRPETKTAEAAQQDAAAPEASPGRSRLRAYLSEAPSWLVSTILHTVALLVLALWTVGIPEAAVMTELFSSRPDADDKIEELDTPIEQEQLEELQEVPALPTDIMDPGASTLADVNAVSEMDVSAVGVGEMTDSPIGEIGALFDGAGQGMAEAGEGSGGAQFFGTRSRGRRFIFVIDNSASMTKGRFETALDEMVKSVQQMDPKQQFFVIFYSDTAYPLFWPQRTEGYANATSKNKDKLRAWLYTVEMCWRTDGEDALKAAVAMRPDVIYVLGDGAFTDKSTELMTGPLRGRVTVHTLGMEVNGKGAKQLQAIAQANGGTYRNVGVSPAAAEHAKKRPIKRNKTRGPVWGIKLKK